MSAQYLKGTWYGKGGSGGAENVVEAYYNPADGLLYEESTFTTAITLEENIIYHDPTTDFFYMYDGTDVKQTNTISKEVTQVEYDALSTAEKNNGTVYYIVDGTPKGRYVAHTGFTPVGTVISVMGTTAPMHYLACDGAVYSIADYPELAAYFEDQFGSKNKFGGNGTTTFGVPDLRGEFLRGTGTNSHSGEGNGAAVGEHQTATQHIMPYLWTGNTASTKIMGFPYIHNEINAMSATTLYPDANVNMELGYVDINPSKNTTRSTYMAMGTSRPTNTSVLYCIATKNIYVDARYNYSTGEQVVGTWLDGKTLYQRTITATAPSAINTPKSLYTFDSSIDTLFVVSGFMVVDDYVICLHDLSYLDSSGAAKFLNRVYIQTISGHRELFMVIGTDNRKDTPVTVTIQYTKTA